MHRAHLSPILLPLAFVLTLTLAVGCSSGRTSTPEPSSGETTETPKTPETTAMDDMDDATGEAPGDATAKAAPQGCTYTTTPLSSATQVQIDCANGTSVVVRQRADGKWEEEARAVAGARPSFASVEQAAKALCCR